MSARLRPQQSHGVSAALLSRWPASLLCLHTEPRAPAPCRVVVKLGPRMDMGPLLPDPRDWTLVTSGLDYAVWEHKAGLASQ